MAVTPFLPLVTASEKIKQLDKRYSDKSAAITENERKINELRKKDDQLRRELNVIEAERKQWIDAQLMMLASTAPAADPQAPKAPHGITCGDGDDGDDDDDEDSEYGGVKTAVLLQDEVSDF